MPDPLSESDLLALLDGSLSSARAAEAEALLRADPELRTRIERMSADRAMLSRLPESLSAPAGITESAMRRAAEITSRESGAPSRHRGVAMLVAAAVGITILAGILGLIINATHPALRARRLAAAPPVVEPTIRELNTGSSLVGPEDPDKPLQTNTAGDIDRKLTELESDDADDPLLDSFLSNMAVIAAHPSDDAAPSALAPAEIAALLRSGDLALRITVDPSGATGAIDRADAHAPTAAPSATPAIPAAIPVEIPEGASDQDVVAALNSAAESLRTRSGVHVEYVRASVATSALAPLATTPTAVLWWSAPANAWHTVRTRTVPVRIEPSPASSGAPSPPASG